jgi:preprotein translocase subunit SecD
MRKLTIAIISLLTLAASVVRADRATIELRPVAANGVEYPTAKGNRLRLGTPLVPPLAIASVTASDSRVDLVVTDTSARELEQATGKNRGRQIAIVVNGVAQSVPVIRDAIKEGKLSVTLRSPQAARQLAKALTTN